jgi:site-specific recombinase XerD
MESTIQGYRHHLHEFGQYLRKAGITSFGALSPALLASFIVECAPGMAPCTRRDLCCHLKVLLRFCHREGITDRDLRGAVGMPQVYRLADVPRSITWDEVRRTLEAVDRRTIRGRRDYAILLFLVTYGLRAHEVAKLTETRAIPGTGTQGWPCDCVSACRSSGRGFDRLSQTR